MLHFKINFTGIPLLLYCVIFCGCPGSHQQRIQRYVQFISPKILNLINDQNVHNWWKFELGIDRNQNNSLINFLLHRQQHKNGKNNISHIRLTICHKYPKLTAMRRQHSFAELAGILANAIIGKQPESDTRRQLN